MPINSLKNKPLNRIILIVHIILRYIQKHPDEETFYIDVGDFAVKSTLLKDRDGVEIAFKRIHNETNETTSIKYNFVETRHTQTASGGDEIGGYENIKVHVDDPNKLDSYYYELLKELKKTYSFILDTTGKLSEKSGDPKLSFQMKKKGLRYTILHFLITTNDFVETKNIAIKFDITKDEVRKTINDTKAIISRNLKVPLDAIFKNDLSGSGYKITNITLKDS